jgi:hypothetical protein
METKQYKKADGALWLKKDKNGNTFLSFSIGDKKYVAWKNKRKLKPTHPDFEIYVSEPYGATKAQALADAFAEDDVPNF